MSDKRKTIVNIPNGEFADEVNSAIESGRKKARAKIENVPADEEYTGALPEVKRPQFEAPTAEEMWAEMRRVWEKYQLAEYHRRKRADERKELWAFIKKTGAIFVAVFVSMAVWHLIGA